MVQDKMILAFKQILVGLMNKLNKYKLKFIYKSIPIIILIELRKYKKKCLF